MSIKWKITYLFILPAIVACIIFMFYSLYNLNQTEHKNVETKIIGLAEKYATYLNGKLYEAAQQAKTTAAYIENNPQISSKQIYDLLNTNLKLNSFLFGSAVCFQPYQYNGKNRLFARYVYREGSLLHEVNPSDLGYDYTEKKQKYWHIPKNTGKAAWTDPYFDEGGGNVMMSTYSVPFFRDNKFRGIATVDIQLDRLRKLIDLKIPKNFSFYLLSSKGEYIYSPHAEHISKTFSSLNEPYEKSRIKYILNAALQKKSGNTYLINTTSGKKDLLAYFSIASTDWSLIISYPNAKIHLRIGGLFYSYLLLFLVILILVICALYWISSKITSPIINLTNTVKSYTQGDFNVKSDIKSKDEIGELAASFNQMGTKIQAHDSRIKKSEKKYRDFLDRLDDIAYETDINGFVTYANQYSEKIIDLPVKDIINKSFLPLFTEESQKLALKQYQATLEGKTILPFELTFSNGHICQFKSTPILDHKGNVIGVSGVARDITELKKAESALRESEEHYKNFFDNALVGFFRTRISDGMYIDLNDKAAQQQGIPAEEIINKIRAVDQYKNPKERSELLAIIKKYGEVHGFETILELPSGKERNISISAKAYPEKDYMEGVVIDITERKTAEKQLLTLNTKLEKLVFSDPLTSAINNKPFMDLLDKNIQRCKREEKKLALLFLDLEKFKQINDIYGHSIGDIVLINAAEIIRKNIRKNDFLGRIGGDEFVVSLYDIKSTTNAIKIAQKINNAFSKKMMIKNLLIDVTVSIGIAVYPDDGDNSSDLLKNSDIAMYKAKKKAKNTYRVFNKEQKDELIFEQELLYALEYNEYELHYQPILNRNRECIFLEALLRWNSPDFGQVLPNAFIPLLENNREIISVGKWVYTEACNQLATLKNSAKYHEIKISVNLSQVQIEDVNFIKDFDNIKKKTGIDGNDIFLELSERKNIHDIENTKEVLAELISNNIGITVLDDFGSGFSSFSNLLRLPVKIVKIDKFLIDNIFSEKHSSMTLDIIKLIKKLGIKTVAEGVERKEQFEKLTEAGCDYFQGFYFSKPQKDIYKAINFDDK
jgi:diguanylate cyclase (GGDEF)-like protein/PAS domain S-box-containing protein